MTVARPVARSGCEPVLRWVEERTGLSFPRDRRASAEALVRRAMSRAGVADPARYRDLLDADAAALDDLLAELTVGETYFFRDPAQLDFIRREVLPGFGRERALRAWSAGCASGEEAYSLAILLREAGRDARVLGTDLSRVRLGLARKARYTRWSLRGVPEQVVRRYFRRSGSRFELDPAIRTAVEFRPLNLAEAADPPSVPGVRGMDLVLCRNVLIYLDEETIARVARRLLDSLGADGWLILGASDPPLSGLVPCEVVVTDAGLAYRRAAGGVSRKAPAPAPPPPTALRPNPAPFPAPVPPRQAPPAAPPPAEEESSAATCAARVRALADQGRLAEAGRSCAAALERHRTSAELTYLHAVLLVQAGRHAEAAEAARRALYLDRSLAVAHLLLGDVLARLGDADGARRALGNAERLLAPLAPAEPVPASGGEPAASLAELARTRLRLLGEKAA